MSEYELEFIAKKKGVSLEKVHKCQDSSEYICDDGTLYIVKTPFRKCITLSRRQYDYARSKLGELLIVVNAQVVKTIPFYELPFVRPGTLREEAGGYKFLVYGVAGSPHTKTEIYRSTVALLPASKDLIMELLGDVEHNVNQSFHSMGEFIMQSVVCLAALTNSIPWAKASRWARYGYSVACPKCMEMRPLTRGGKRAKLAWVITCAKCGHRFVALDECLLDILRQL